MFALAHNMPPAPAHHSRQALPPKTSARMQMIAPQAKNRPGEPFFCPTGYFGGKHIQAVLEEVQKGDRARKMAGEGGKDARQVDPPPVARLTLRERHTNGSYSELPAESVISNVQLVCNVELYPWNIEYDEAWPGVDLTNANPPPSAIQPVGARTTRLAVEKQYPPALPSAPRRPLGPHAALTTQFEGNRSVHTMFGARTVAAQLCRHKGAIYFIFDDLKIRRTGQAFVEIRSPMPCIAETWGGVFAVYPSRTAPPLRESTELTKHLNSCGLLARARRKPRQRRGDHEHDEPDHDEHSNEDEGDIPFSGHGRGHDEEPYDDGGSPHPPPPSTPGSARSSSGSGSGMSPPPVSPLESTHRWLRHERYDPVRDVIAGQGIR